MTKQEFITEVKKVNHSKLLFVNFIKETFNITLYRAKFFSDDVFGCDVSFIVKTAIAEFGESVFEEEK